MDKLLAAGAVELAEVGHEALSIRTVAARAGVSPASAYNYFASKNHLFAELFLGYLDADGYVVESGGDVVGRVRAVTRSMAANLGAAPELAAAATAALLGSDPDVRPLRTQIGSLFADRFRAALAGGSDEVDTDVLDALLLAFSGALLQAGMGIFTYPEMGDRLDVVVATILRGPTP